MRSLPTLVASARRGGASSRARCARTPELEKASRLYQGLRQIYAQATTETAPALWTRCYRDVERSELLEFRGLVDGAFRIWEREILAYFDVCITNAYAEGITNKIKVIKRSGYGFRNFARFRERVLVQWVRPNITVRGQGAGPAHSRRTGLFNRCQA